jgi:predicted dithiol-disulfide oxidoreductase (DUF899 family)
MLLDANHYLDLTPEGRNEKAYAWPRRFDEYPAKAGLDESAARSAATR